jgi:hypothetical protein
MAAKIPQLEGFFDAVGHGTPTAVLDEFGEELNAAELAARIRATPSWGGQNVRLLSCETGACSTGFAQQLANELRVKVLAPTTKFAADWNGNITFDDGGEFLEFIPQ